MYHYCAPHYTIVVYSETSQLFSHVLYAGQSASDKWPVLSFDKFIGVNKAVTHACSTVWCSMFTCNGITRGCHVFRLDVLTWVPITAECLDGTARWLLVSWAERPGPAAVDQFLLRGGQSVGDVFSQFAVERLLIRRRGPSYPVRRVQRLDGLPAVVRSLPRWTRDDAD